MAPIEDGPLARLAGFVAEGPLIVLTGAGCSTESGVPDYRGPEGRLRVRRPVLYQEFMRDRAVRQRYWARSAAGWLRFRDACPNDAHHALAGLEMSGMVRGIITQNVDGLHGEAGSQRVVELHGSLASVCCLGCKAVVSRESVQQWIERENPNLVEEPHRTAPDGDADVSEEALRGFRAPTCRACGGDLKPDVVFFGENVPRQRVGRAWKLLDEGAALLVVGSSLAVYSGRRFVLRAVERGVPVAILNLGPTRCDDDAVVRVEGRAGEVLSALVSRLQSRRESGTRTFAPSTSGESSSGLASSSPGLT